MLDANEVSSMTNTFILTWRFKPVNYNTLWKMIQQTSSLGSVLSLDQFTYRDKQMTRHLLRQILGWQDNLHPAMKMKFEIASDAIFSLRKMRVLALTRQSQDDLSYKYATGIISIDVSGTECLTRLELHFPLSN